MDFLGEYGKTMSTISVIGTTIISIILIAIGIYFLVHKSKSTHPTLATITNAQCNLNSNKKHNCTLTLSYNINNTKYTNILNTTNTIEYIKGQNIKIYYDNKNPKIISLNNASYNKMIAIFLIIFGLIILIMAWIYFYFAHKSKTFATILGAEDLLRL